MTTLKELQEVDKQHLEELRDLRKLIEKDGKIMNMVLRSSWEHDAFWFRFLRARDYNVKKAMIMVEKYYAYLDESKVLETTPNMVESILKNKAISFMGFDKSGRGAFLIQPEFIVPGEMDYSLVGPAFLMVILLCAQEVREKGEERFHLIFRYDNWGYRNIDRKLDRVFMQIGQDMLPERLYRAHLVNAPWYFSAVFALCKPFLNYKTTQKFMFVNDKNTKQHFESEFAKDQLIKDWGGSVEQPESLFSFVSSRMDADQTLRDALVERDVVLGFTQKQPEKESQPNESQSQPNESQSQPNESQSQPNESQSQPNETESQPNNSM